ncbi:MAG: AMP-binding protein, partial [Moorella sp. (in: Bacteria)]|nr:AMP-binding protein [Moorella sp. (in: firmicutes)]
MLLWQLPQRHKDLASHPALSFQNKRITYGELVRWIDAYASLLQQMGLQPGEKVAICSPNCPEFIYSYLG